MSEKTKKQRLSFKKKNKLIKEVKAGASKESILIFEDKLDFRMYQDYTTSKYNHFQNDLYN